MLSYPSSIGTHQVREGCYPEQTDLGAHREEEQLMSKNSEGERLPVATMSPGKKDQCLVWEVLFYMCCLLVNE